MRHGKPIKKSRSKRLFHRTAKKTHGKNNRRAVMRGGIRL